MPHTYVRRRASCATLSRSATRIRPCSIQYHADQDLDELCRFWGVTIRIDPNGIRMQRKSNSNQLTGRNWRSKYGVLTVWVGDTMLRARLQAWMDRLRSEWQ